MLRPFLVMQLSLNGSCIRLMSTKPREGGDLSPKQLLLKLRNTSGYPLINCKEALKAAKYDLEQAEQYLMDMAKDKGWNKMQDISGKLLTNGILGVARNKSSAAIVEVNCATDFVAKTTEFQRIVKEAAEISLNNFAASDKVSIQGEDLMDVPIHGKDQTLKDDIAMVIGKLKENILVRRAGVLTPPPGGAIGLYVHPSVLISSTRPGSMLGSFAAIASLSCVNGERSPSYIKSKGRDICQHIVGMKPLSIGEGSEIQPLSEDNVDISDAVDKDEVECANEVVADQRQFAQPKEGSTELLKQPFLLDTDISVEQWLDMTDIKIHNFIRFQVGEVST